MFFVVVIKYTPESLSKAFVRYDIALQKNQKCCFLAKLSQDTITGHFKRPQMDASNSHKWNCIAECLKCNLMTVGEGNPLQLQIWAANPLFQVGCRGQTVGLFCFRFLIKMAIRKTRSKVEEHDWHLASFYPTVQTFLLICFKSSMLLFKKKKARLPTSN